MKLKDRWKSESPRYAKALGDISLIIAVAGSAISYAYVDLPEELRSYIPEKLAIICALGGFISRFLLQFTVVNTIFNERKQVLTKHKRKKK